jgi:N-acetylglucosaminyldiphosphoundecaprenol N-acetyl-beta-D-mannosaminyltransferase
MKNMKKTQLFGMQIDALRMSETVAQLLNWTAQPDGSCHYVVTPNVDHAVMYQEHAGLRAAYADAGLVLADGFPVLVASKLLRRGIPERVPGSDLVPALFETVQQLALCPGATGSASAEADLGRSSQNTGGASGTQKECKLRVYLLGAAPGVAERAAQKIVERWSAVEIVGTYSPPMGFEKDEAENERILEKIATARPDVLVVGLGAPKQELWVHAHCKRIAAPVALCVGATIDFLADEKPRAPVWMRRVGLEWAHRLASEPRRLAKRYLRDAWIFPRLILKEMFGSFPQPAATPLPSPVATTPIDAPGRFDSASWSANSGTVAPEINEVPNVDGVREEALNR